MNRPEPNFFVIGSSKAGTTALFHHLDEHPEIGMARIKEPNFFSQRVQPLAGHGPQGEVRWSPHLPDLDAYLQLFSNTPHCSAIGEISPSYLATPGTAEKLHEVYPAAKIVAILRHPAERAFSAYQHLIRNGSEDLDFPSALQAEAERRKKGFPSLWHYFDQGLYSKQLAPWFQLFPEEQRLIVPYECWKEDPARFLKILYQFLGVSAVIPDNLHHRHNVGGHVRFRSLHHLLTTPNVIKKAAKTIIPDRLHFTLQKKLTSLNLRPNQIPGESLGELNRLYAPEVKKIISMCGPTFKVWEDKYT